VFEMYALCRRDSLNHRLTAAGNRETEELPSREDSAVLIDVGYCSQALDYIEMKSSGRSRKQGHFQG
jgi:hypothetical protein